MGDNGQHISATMIVKTLNINWLTNKYFNIVSIINIII